jgi:hypothetical protein
MSQRLSARIAPFDRIGDSSWNRNAIEERSASLTAIISNSHFALLGRLAASV